MYRYIMKSTNKSSDKYGVCEICGKHASEVFHQIEEKQYNWEGEICWTQHGCNNLFGHKECLEGYRK